MINENLEAENFSYRRHKLVMLESKSQYDLMKTIQGHSGGKSEAKTVLWMVYDTLRAYSVCWVVGKLSQLAS